MLASANPLGAIDRAARLTDVAVDRAVQLEHALRAGRLVQAVDVLRHHGIEFAGTFQLRQLDMAAIGFGAKRNHLGPVEVEELRRM